MKKILAITAAAAMLLCFTACGSTTNDTSDSKPSTSGSSPAGNGAGGSDSGMGGSDSGMGGTGGMGGDITDGNTESNAPDGFIDPSTGEGAIIGGTNDDTTDHTHPDGESSADSAIDSIMNS